jgi:hypothetical protein
MSIKNSPDRVRADVLSARKVRLMREINTLFDELSDLDSALAEAVVVDLNQQLTEKSKEVINDAPPLATVRHDSAYGAGETSLADVDGREAARDTDIKSFLKPNEIDQRSLDNRKLRGPLLDEIALLLLLANDERNIVYDDIKKEFASLRIEIEDSTLLSRLSRLRSDNRKALEPVSTTGTGFYRLSTGGRKVAQDFREKRWPDRLASAEPA